MAYLHLKIKQIVTDTEGDGANARPRVRVQFEEYEPRSGYINLKNASAEQINELKNLVGGDAMIPVREGMMNGQTYFQFIQTDKIVPIHQPEKIATSQTVEIPAGKPAMFNKPA